jgi:hypothetical protein
MSRADRTAMRNVRNGVIGNSHYLRVLPQHDGL